MLVKIKSNLSGRVLLVLASMLIAQVTSAREPPTNNRCASWGCSTFAQWVRGDTYNLEGTTDDTLEDGYCVYIRYRKAGESWPAHNGGRSTKSCGPKVSYLVDTGSKHPAAGVRLYREDGRYLTLYGN